MRRLAVLGLVFVAAILSCGKDVTGPLGSAARYVRGLSWDAVFPPAFLAAGGSGVVPFSRVHIVLHHDDGTVALDTTIDFPAGADSVTLSLTVKLLNNAPAGGEPMTLNLGYINAAGDTVFKGGPVSITAAPPPPGGGSNPPVKVPLSYTGPGAGATSVVISPRSTTAFVGSAFSFSAVAKDIGGNVLAGTPVIWNSLDPSIATITSAAAGAGAAQSQRGTARIIAQLLTGPADTVQVFVLLPAANLVAQSGNGQFGIVGTTLALPLVAKVAATDGVGVAGTTVNFAVATGGGSVGSASAISDANGLAQTTFKLGTGAGAQTVTATAAGLTNSPVTFIDTAKAATAAKLVVTAQPVNGVAGIALTPVVVTAEDNNGNIATTFTGPVAVAFGANTTGATLGGTVTVNAVAGVATFSTLAVNKNGSGYNLAASSAALTGATTNAFDIAVGAPKQLVFTVQPSGALANAAMSPAIVVNAQDSQGNPTPSFTGAVTLGFATNPTSATLGGTLTVNAAGGAATFAGISVSASGTGYALSASATGLTAATSTTFNIGGGVATNIAVASGGGQTGPPSVALALPVVILVTDAGANPVAGTTVNFAVLTGGGAVAPVSGVTNGAGQVQTTWTLGAPLGAQTISATSAGLAGSPLTITATAAVGAPTHVVFTQQPTNATAGVAIAPAMTVTAKDALNNTVGSFVGNVTLTFGANPGGSVLSGATTVAAVAGIATFNNISLNKAAVGYTLNAASGALTPDISTAFNIVAGPAANLAVSSGQAQSGLASTVLGAPLAVLVTDALANPVAGRTITWAVTSGGGSVSLPSSITNAAGIATDNWTLGAAPGPGTVSATSAGLAGSPLTFNSTATVAAASKTWTGATDALWATATNWAPAGAPAATDSVFIPVTGNNPTLAASTSVTSLYIAAGASLTLTSGAVTLGVNGALDATGAGIVGTGNVALTPPVNRNIKGAITAGTVTIFGSYTQNGALVIVGNVVINSGGSLALNGNTTTVTGNFSTAGTGTLTMNNALDILIVTGNVSFGGGSTTGLLTNGSISLTGSFTQSNSVTSFAASGLHQVAFAGAVAQTINMANPGTSTFAKLTSANSAGVTLLTNVVTVSDFTTVGPVTGAFALTIGGQLADPAAGVAVSAISFSGSANPVSAGTATINENVTFNSASVLLGNLTVNGAVSVNSAAGSLTIGGHTLTVNGTFTTSSSGTLVMNVPGAVLSVNGNATFSGGASTLTNGKIVITGNFTQNTTATSFTASGLHKTRFLGTTPTISFANPTTSSFGRLELQSSGIVNFTTDVLTTGDVWVQTGGPPSITNAGGTVTIGGALYDSTGGRWQVANTTMTGAGPLPRSMNTNLTITGALTLTDSVKLSAGNNLAITAGNLTLGGHYVKVPGNFSTSGAGVFTMTAANDSLIVNGNASFNGGNTTGKLTNGLFEFNGGSFTQGTTATAFAATSPHVTYFWGANPQNINFANPGAASSHFGILYLGDTSTVLASDVVATGQFQTGIVISHEVRSTGADHLLTSDGANMRNTRFVNVRWKVAGINGNGSFPSIDNVFFDSTSNTGAAQFDFEYSVTTNLTLANFTFFTTPTSGGSYIKIVGPDTLTMTGVNPSANGGWLNLSGLGAVNGWPNTATWTGAATTSAWNTAGNWDIGAVPTASNDVVIGSSIYQPATGGAVTVKSLNVSPGMTLSVTGANMTVNGDIIVQPSAAIALPASGIGVNANGNVTTDTAGTTGVTICSGNAGLNLDVGTHTVTGKFCNLNNFGTYTASGPIQVVSSGTLFLDGGNFTLNGHRVDAYAFFLNGTGTLTMQNAADSLLIHGGAALFQGGSETGLMTAGTIVDRSSNLSATGFGFDATGSQTLVVDTTFFQTITWTAPVAGHGLNNVFFKHTWSRGFSGNINIAKDVTIDFTDTTGTIQGAYTISVGGNIIDNSPSQNLWQVGTTVLTGTPTILPFSIPVNTIVFNNGGGTISLPHDISTNYVTVDGGTTLKLNGHFLKLNGNYFTTQNGGMLNMTTAGDSLESNQLFFNGGSTSGLLTAGGINVTGPVFGILYQGYDGAHTPVAGTSTTAFAASGTRVWFNPSFGANVAFHDPGSGGAGSHFHFVQAKNGAPISVLSNVFVDSLLLGEVSGDTWQSDSAAQTIVRTITTKGIYNSGSFGLALKAVNIVLNEGLAASTSFNTVTWTSFPASYTGTLFTQNRTSAGPSIGFNTWSAVSLGVGGEYLKNIGSAILTVGSSNSSCFVSLTTGQTCP